jgi:hypothetical protein
VETDIQTALRVIEEARQILRDENLADLDAKADALKSLRK